MVGKVPVACTLSDPELRKRKATLLAELKSVLIGIEELDNGYVFRLPGDRRSIALATEVIVAEHECCPFLVFSLSVGPGMAPAQLRVIGPDNGKELLKDIFA